MTRSFVWFLGFIFLFVFNSHAHEDEIKTKMDKAKSVYEVQLEKFRNDVLAKLDQLEVSARKKGDTRKVEKLAEEKTTFEIGNIVPQSLVPLGFERKQIQIRKSLEMAYNSAAKDFTRSKKDDEAKGVQDELDQFLESFDTLKVNTVWGGEHSQKFGSDPKITKQGVKLTITVRKGNSFKGNVVVQNGVKFPVEGTIEHGSLKFKDTEKGHKYEGLLVGKSLNARFEGFSRALNTDTTGTWALSN